MLAQTAIHEQVLRSSRQACLQVCLPCIPEGCIQEGWHNELVFLSLGLVSTVFCSSSSMLRAHVVHVVHEEIDCQRVPRVHVHLPCAAFQGSLLGTGKQRLVRHC